MPNVRLDQTAARDGLRITAQNVWPGPKLDLLKAARLIPAKRVRGGFEHPRWLPSGTRRFERWEAMLSFLAGEGRLSPDFPASTVVPGEKLRADVVVVGGGEAGCREAAALGGGRQDRHPRLAARGRRRAAGRRHRALALRGVRRLPRRPADRRGAARSRETSDRRSRRPSWCSQPAAAPARRSSQGMTFPASWTRRPLFAWRSATSISAASSSWARAPRPRLRMRCATPAKASSRRARFDRSSASSGAGR